MNYLTEIDKTNIKKYVELYGADKLCESNYHWADDTGTKYDSQMHTYGASREGAGWKGILKGAPIFILTSIFCFPLAALMALGAVNNLMYKAFHKRTSLAQQYLNPFSSMQSIATQNWKRPAEKDYDTRDTSSGEKGPLGKLKDEWKERWKKAVGIKSDALDDKEYDPEYLKKLTPTELAALSFINYWVILSNGEVLKVRSDSERNASGYARVYCAQPGIKEHYEKMNKLMKESTGDRYHIYKVYFEDGQLLYSIGTNKEDAKACAAKCMIGLVKSQNTIAQDVDIHMEEMKVPNVINVEGTTLTHVDMPTGAEVSTTPPSKERTPGAPARGLVYRHGIFDQFALTGFEDYIGWRELKFNIPATSISQAVAIAKELNQEPMVRDYIRAIQEFTGDPSNGIRFYKVTTPDKDVYLIPIEISKIAGSSSKENECVQAAEKGAFNLYAAKMAVLMHFFKRHDSEQYNALVDICNSARIGTGINPRSMSARETTPDETHKIRHTVLKGKSDIKIKIRKYNPEGTGFSKDPHDKVEF